MKCLKMVANKYGLSPVTRASQGGNVLFSAESLQAKYPVAGKRLINTKDKSVSYKIIPNQSYTRKSEFLI